jgi:hypothetical protein
VQGLSLGLTAGAPTNKLVGSAEYINELSDFAGTYSVVGAGAALVGGVGGVQLRNDKGVTITLQGPKVGLEVSANITKVVITLDQSTFDPTLIYNSGENGGRAGFGVFETFRQTLDTASAEVADA